MSSENSNQSRIEGTVAPGFESVRDLYHTNMQVMAEEHTQLCVYHRGEKVVDLWASKNSDNPIAADSLVNIFSSGKSLEAIALASLVSKGLLKYETKISEYWPEFATNGKEQTTVADLMRHEAGMANFTVSMEPDDLLRSNIKQNKVGQIIEQQPQRYGNRGENKREYHALTRGWIANEVFRRVDPTGRTIGEFLEQDIAGPLEADVKIGVKEEELGRIRAVKPLSFGTVLLESLKPKFMGRGIVHNLLQIIARILRILPGMRKGTSAGAPPPIIGLKKLSFFNLPEFAMGETPSANATCSARGLAKVAAVMSCGGSFAGKEYLSSTAWKALHDNVVDRDLGGLMPTRFTQGGVALFATCDSNCPKIGVEFNEGREGFYGWMGFGGSIFQWHPEYDIGFAFVPTSLHVMDLVNERGKYYQAEVLRCIEKLNAE